MGVLLEGGRGAGPARAAARGGRQDRLGGQAGSRLDEALAGQRWHRVAVLEGVDLLRWGLVRGGGALGAPVVPDPRGREGDDGDDAHDDDGRDRELAPREGQLAVTEEAEL